MDSAKAAEVLAESFLHRIQEDVRIISDTMDTRSIAVRSMLYKNGNIDGTIPEMVGGHSS